MFEWLLIIQFNKSHSIKFYIEFVLFSFATVLILKCDKNSVSMLSGVTIDLMLLV